MMGREGVTMFQHQILMRNPHRTEPKGLSDVRILSAESHNYPSHIEEA